MIKICCIFFKISDKIGFVSRKTTILLHSKGMLINFQIFEFESSTLRRSNKTNVIILIRFSVNCNVLF